MPEDRAYYGQLPSTGDVQAVMEHLGLERTHLVDTLISSFTSLEFALTHPERVLSVTLIGNSSGLRDETELIHFCETWIGHKVALLQTRGRAGTVELLEDDTA